MLARRSLRLALGDKDCCPAPTPHWRMSYPIDSLRVCSCFYRYVHGINTPFDKITARITRQQTNDLSLFYRGGGDTTEWE